MFNLFIKNIIYKSINAIEIITKISHFNYYMFSFIIQTLCLHFSLFLIIYIFIHHFLINKILFYK